MSKESKKNVLAINNVDLYGKRFNGYDIMEYINSKDGSFKMKQVVTYKVSNNNNVKNLFDARFQELENTISNFEYKYLSVHSCLSVSTPALLNSKEYQESDLLHFHIIHNTKLSLYSLIKMCNEKPAIISIHDPWNFTGRCVHFEDCKNYLTGCKSCPNLKSLFPLKKDNCSELWKLKKMVYDNIDVDFVVSSKYMYDLFKSSPLTSKKRVHLIPLGIDLKEFSVGISQKKAKEHFNIPTNNVVMFHRAQKAFKGTEYLLEALKELDTDKDITILTCSEKNLLDDVKNKYQVIDLGNIDSNELKYAYNACDFFVMPSIGESFGMMAIEAMSCSKPVIVFNNTALPSVTFAPDCGILVKNKDSHDLCRALKWMIDDKKERIRRGKKAREICEKEYDINIYYKKIEELYKEVIDRKHEKYTQKNIINEDFDCGENELKVILNKLTKKLVNANSNYYKKLLYPINVKKRNSNKILYSSLKIQKIIDKYNYKIYNYFCSNDSFKKSEILFKMIHRFIYLLIHDRTLLIETIKMKLRR